MSPSYRRRRWIRWGIFSITLFVILGLEALLIPHNPDVWEIVLLAALGLAGAVLLFWQSASWLGLVEVQSDMTSRLEGSEADLKEIQKRLTATLQINARLADATDEASLMKAVLTQFGDLVGASGSTYIPMDNLGQPLAVVHHGQVPESEQMDWSRLALSPEVQDRCRSCTLRHASLTENCPLHRPQVFGQTEIYCLPLAREARMLGMVNLYVPADQPLSRELGLFLESLLSEIALAIDSLRLRNQEISTLRQLQLGRSLRRDMNSLLKELLSDAVQALEADYGLIWLQANDRAQPQMVYASESSICLDSPLVQALIQMAVKTRDLVMVSFGETELALPESVGAVLVASLCIADSSSLGVLLVANKDPHAFYPRQQKVMRSIASQAAILVENERFLLELEYRSVIEERNRLAREIHDGLAQTLAFLKLQASQMQTYLTRGDMQHLHETLETSYKTLTEAYLDTRQAIDNLRVTPQDSMVSWLTQAAEDFTNTTRIPMELSIQEEPEGIPLEVQAQLLRVIQESLNNIRKHARAKRVKLTMNRWQDDLILEVHDDGQGFSPEDIPQISRYGLRGMRERAEMIGADFQVISSPEKGTTVRIRLPYRLEESPV